jgi:hypothetical protein
MKSFASARFWRLYSDLPISTRRQADKAYRLWLDDPYHGGLQFKRIHPGRPIYSVRISRDWRALGIKKDEEIVWFWIGSHSEYDHIISRL